MILRKRRKDNDEDSMIESIKREVTNKKQSSRDWYLNLEQLNVEVGRQLGGTKALVVQHFAAFITSSQVKFETAQKPQISFNKMSGITEWKNGCFIWLNLDDHTPYYNQFFKVQDQLHFKWYGSPRHRADTPVILRLLDPSTEVFLFCRLVCENYINYGRIICFAVDLLSHPISIEWILKDQPLLDHDHSKIIQDLISKS